MTYRPFEQYAEGVRQNGFSVFPIKPAQKKCYWKNWTQFCRQPPSEVKVQAWSQRYPDWSTAIACGWTVVGIDIDETDEERAALLETTAFSVLGTTPLIRIGRWPRRLLVYRPSGEIKRTKIGNIDILGEGSYFVGFGIHPNTHAPYTWRGSSPATLPRSELPSIGPRDIARLRLELDSKKSNDAHSSNAPHPGQASPSSAPSSRCSIRSFRTLVWETDRAGRVIDGRDAYLAQLVWKAAQGSQRDAAFVGRIAWSRFADTADLTRPKRNTGREWSESDAVAKAQALVASGKLDRTVSPFDGDRREDGFWTLPVKNAFSKVVDAAGADRRLSPAAVTVSRLMLGLIYNNGTCYASVERIAEETGYSIPAVKKARQQLRERGYWQQRLAEGGRGHLAHYTPNPAALMHEVPVDTARADRQRVYVSGSAIFQGEGVGKEPEDWTFILFEDKESHKKPQSHKGVHQVPTNSPSSTADAVVEVPGDRDDA